MIEINLVPDVKQELIKARRIRTVVITGAVLIGLVAIGIVVALAFYVFAVQGLRSSIADGNITSENDKLSKVQDLSKTLTIQNQLAQLSSIYSQTNVDSRFFDLLGAINPPAPNNVTFSLTRVDSDSMTIRLEGQAANGYPAADVLKKTILGTKIKYQDEDNKTQTVNLTNNVSTSELSFGEDSTGNKVLRFTMTFTYDQSFFARSSKGALIVKPDEQDATDSYVGLPSSLFSDRSSSNVGGAQ